MLTLHLYRGSALVLLAAVCACGPDWSNATGDADPYNGVIDNTSGAPTFFGTNTTGQGALAANFQPIVPSSTQRAQCNNATSCYLPITGFAAGKAIKFFIAGRMSSNTPPFQPATCASSNLGCAYAPTMADHYSDGGGGFHAYAFPHSCKAAGYDPVQDAFPRDQQWPIVDALPLNNANLSSPHTPLGLAAVYGVTGVSETCNDLKNADSIVAGRLGAQAPAKASGFEVWMLFDPTVTVLAQAGPNAPALATGSFWYRGLQASYLNGGPVPVDANGNLIAMDGIILDPSGGGFEVTTTNNAIVLPAQPGEDGFSPIVRLHDFTLPSGKKLGDYKGVCLLGDSACEAAHKSDFVFLSSLSASAQKAAFNTVFLAVSPQ